MQSQKVLVYIVTCLLLAPLSIGQSTTFSCEKNWCGEKWKKYDRIHVYNYTEELQNVSFTKNVTYTKKDCNPLNLLISPNGDGCKTINVTHTETITFRVPVHQRNSEPETRELPQELTLGLIVTENIDIFGNDSKDTYSELEDKIWQIWVPRGCRLVLFFSEFDLESSPNCTKDYFTIQQTKNQKNIPKYCGGLSSLPEEGITVDKIRTQLHFHSDETNTRKGVHATFCFQKSKNVSPDDIPCSCNTDTSGIKKRRAGTKKEKSGSRSKSKSGTFKESTRSEKTKKSKKLTKKQMKKLMKEQDKEVALWLRDMMKHGLKSINQYRYSSNRKKRALAEKYQEALDMTLV